MANGKDNTNKIRIGAVCGISFIIISSLIFRTSFHKIPLFFLYNIIIILSGQGLGFYRCLFFLSSSIILTILFSLASDFYYVWNVFVFLGVFLIVDDKLKKVNYYTHITNARIDELNENMNLVTDEYQRHQKEALTIEKREHRYQALKDVSSVLNSTLFVDKVVEYIVDNALHIVGKTQTCILFLVDNEKQELQLNTSRFVEEDVENLSHRYGESIFKARQEIKDRTSFHIVKAKKGDVLDEWVVRQRQCLLVEDIKKDFRFSEEITEDYSRCFRSLISCPLMEGRKIAGLIRMEHSKPYNYTAEDLRLLDILSDLGAASLENAKLYKKTLDLAITDSLTGLYVRRFFTDKLKDELLRSLHNNLECSFLMVDIDDFKQYNDRFGHTAGDIVIKTVSKLLQDFSGLGTGCIVGRYGGEEFSVLLPETNKENGMLIAEKIRGAIKKESIRFRQLKTNISVSIGVASFPDDAKLYDELIMKADERLYLAKRQGKDRVV